MYGYFMSSMYAAFQIRAMCPVRKTLLSCACLFSILLLSACSFNNPFLSSPQPAPPSLAKPKNITLLVPLEKGKAQSGQAVRNGFLAAYYYAKQTVSDAPAIHVIDTNGENILNLYQQAVSKGSDFIVGPLTKQNVQALASQNHLTVPTLALNALDDAKIIKNLYQFGLLQQDEAEQVAMRARQNGFSRAIILTPSGNWGTDIANAFQKKWRKLGGTVASNWAYPPRGNMAAMVKNALNGSATKGDMVFLAAFPPHARQIRPLITFYGGRNLPVYATSLVYVGVPSEQDHDLDGIIFADMPWIIGPDTPAWSQIRSNIQTMDSGSYDRYPRLYALGIDAYHLTYAFNRLSLGVDGATGKLTLDSDQHIHRTLNWAKFVDGKPQQIP